MELYEKICPLGEGTYGMVMKCKHIETHQIVAIKKFKDSEDDAQIRKTAMREVKMLKNLRHDNVVALLEVFRRKGKLYLVFEHIDRTILFDIEKYTGGIPDDPLKGDFVRKSLFQILRGVDFLHSHNVMHRDMKNILVSKTGVIKLCDFGFARSLGGPGAKYTDYVATRWYRAPELLVGDVQYGPPVDVWAIGCIFAELLSSQPLFPGDTDLDQLFRIMRYCGPLPKRFIELFAINPYYTTSKVPEIKKPSTIQMRFNNSSKEAIQLLLACLHHEPYDRPSCAKLLTFQYFSRDSFISRYDVELRSLLDADKDGRLPSRQKPKKVRSLTVFTDLQDVDIIPHLPVQHIQNIPAVPFRKELPAFPVKKSYTKDHDSHGGNQFTSNPPKLFYTNHQKLHHNMTVHDTLTHNTYAAPEQKGKFLNARPLEFSLPKINPSLLTKKS